ncbi:unnamed protein product [Sphenostylis stenocarpa]|uniref:Uncharacterized protein n=1 Tax=Sphenostylis stenocarpa TaxID=92480 RepID=A0AA86W5J7_9FABA|nr:unnamed protein product [Sphenostylis stenocarpa]
MKRVIVVMEKCYRYCTSQGIGAPQFEDMVNMKTSHVVLIEPRQYLILHFFPSPILPGQPRGLHPSVLFVSYVKNLVSPPVFVYPGNQTN